MRRTIAIMIGVTAAAVAVVAGGAVLWSQAASSPLPMTAFPPWYPAENPHGDAAYVDYEAHVPCTIDPVPDAACQRVKLGIVLYGDAATREPTTYVMSIVRVGVGDEREVHHGRVSTDRGTAFDAEATVYRLDGVPDHLREYWAVGEDILLLLDDERMPRVGDAAYSFALNAVPLRTHP